MENGYIDGVDVPDYDERVSKAIEAVKHVDDPEAWNPFAGDEYRMGIGNHDGEAYRFIDVSMSEGHDLESALFEMGLRDTVGLRGSIRGMHWLMCPDTDKSP
ncbi:hypothetical protein AAG587_11145 [Vreelandella neptunia]|uniref:hypothetical protein n=1 Tax=Vreelandella neptunia TaxID=115551 RepID=UPI00315A5E4C